MPKPSVQDKPKPIKIKVGAVSLPVYHYGDERWAVVYRLTKGGKRHTISCRTEAEARKKAHDKCIEIARGQVVADRLSADQRLQAVEAGQLLAPLGLSLDGVAREVVAAHELTGGAGIAEMARFWSQHHHAATSKHTAAEVLEAMLAVKKTEGLDSEYLRNVREPLKRFAAALPGPIAEITAKLIREYLGKLKVQPRTRNGIRASIVMLFRFARAAGDLADGRTTEAEKVGKVKEPRKPPKVYTPAQLQKWLEVVRAEWLPWMVLGAFAGVRTKEIARMDWSDIQWITREVHIRPEVAKTGEGRFIPMQDNLVAWLATHRKGTGPIIPIKSGRVNHVTAKMTEAMEKLGGPAWDRNALRHSYGSHRLGIIQDLGKLTWEMGNSIAVNRRNYQNPRSREQCVAYFNLYPAEESKPKTGKKVLSMEEEAAKLAGVADRNGRASEAHQ